MGILPCSWEFTHYSDININIIPKSDPNPPVVEKSPVENNLEQLISDSKAAIKKEETKVNKDKNKLALYHNVIGSAIFLSAKEEKDYKEAYTHFEKAISYQKNFKKAYYNYIAASLKLINYAVNKDDIVEVRILRNKIKKNLEENISKIKDEEEFGLAKDFHLTINNKNHEIIELIHEEIKVEIKDLESLLYSKNDDKTSKKEELAKSKGINLKFLDNIYSEPFIYIFNPKHMECHNNNGIIYILLNKNGYANDEFDKAAENDVTQSDTNYKKLQERVGDILKIGIEVDGEEILNLIKSDKSLDRLLKSDVTDMLVGANNINEGKYEEAIESFLKAIEKNPKNANYPLMLGMIFEKIGNYKIYNTNFGKYLHNKKTIDLKIDPSVMDRFKDISKDEIFASLIQNESIGQSIVENIFYSEAVYYYEMAINNDKTNIFPYILLGQLLMNNTKDYQKAIQILKKPIDHKYGDHKSHFLAKKLLSQAYDGLSKKILRNTLSNEDQSFSSLLNKHFENYNNDKVYEAIDKLKTSIKIYENNPSGYDGLGFIYARILKKYKKAEYYLKKAYDINPYVPAIHQNFGFLYEKIENFCKSQKSYKDYLKFKGNDITESKEHEVLKKIEELEKKCKISSIKKDQES